MSRTHKIQRARKAHSAFPTVCDYYNWPELRTLGNSKEFKELCELMQTGGRRHGNNRKYYSYVKVHKRKVERAKLKQEDISDGWDQDYFVHT